MRLYLTSSRAAITAGGGLLAFCCLAEWRRALPTLYSNTARQGQQITASISNWPLA